MVDLVVVICHFKEDLGWIDQLKHPYVIYNKNPKNEGEYDFNIPNYGFDTVAYVKYIIDNYDNLPNYVCFSQDDPFFHCEEFLNKVNGFDGLSEFCPLGKTYERDNEDTLKQTIDYAKRVGIEFEEPIKFINSAQCIVSSKLIRSTSIDVYKNIMYSYDKNSVINQTNYLIEYLWPTIMNFNDKLELSFNNCRK